MDYTPIINVVATVTGVGVVLGAGLATAAQVFAVKVDQAVSDIEEVLPGINCGACGFPGCSGYANAVVSGSDVPSNLCIPGGPKVAARIAEITGKTADTTQKKVSLLRCVQDKKLAAPLKYDYHGINDCAALELLHNGAFMCSFACAGLGNCERACPAKAITMKDGRPHIDPVACTGCGICVKICPRDVLILGEYPGRVQVYCRNTNPPKTKRKICPSACIGCSLCVKNCPYNAIKMINFVAVVEHSKCPHDCPRPCLEKCPTGAILARGTGANEINVKIKKKIHGLEAEK